MMASKNLSQHEQNLKLLESNIKEIDDSYQQVVDYHKQMDNALHAISNLIFKLYLIVSDLRETCLEFEKAEGN